MKIASFFKVLFLLLMSSGFLQAQNLIYSEDFNGDVGQGNDGGVEDLSAVNWTLNTDNCTIELGDYIKVVETGSDRLEAFDSDGEAIWMSPSIDILGYTNISISGLIAELGSSGTATSKYIKLYYKLDGGAEILIGELLGNQVLPNPNSLTVNANVTDASSLHVIAKMKLTVASTNKIYIDDILVTGTAVVVSNDALTHVLKPSIQVVAQNISSVINDQSSAHTLLKFKLSELGGDDELDTKIASVKFTNVASDNQAGLSSQFEGFAIHDGSNFIPTSSVEINTDEVALNFAEGDFTLPDDSSHEYELRAYLKPSGITDGKKVTLELAAGATGITTYQSGSAFDTANSEAVVSPEHLISVVGTNLYFRSIPTNSPIKNSNFSVSLGARDINGNIDLDANQNIDLSLENGNGILAGVLANNFSSGQVTFNDLSYNLTENINLKAEAIAYISAISDPISIVSSQTTDISLPVWIPSSSKISPVSNLEEDAIEIFRFSVNDKGDDLESTFLNALRFVPGDNNSMSWEENIAGVELKVGETILDAAYTFNNSAINIIISETELLREISEGTSRDYSIFVYLKTTLTDLQILQLKIENTHEGWGTSGSGLIPSFIGDLSGPNFTIDVQGSKLVFTNKPPKTIVPNVSFEMGLKAIDKYGNQDLSSVVEARVSLASGSGELFSSLGLNTTLIEGEFSWNDLIYNAAENFTILIEAEGMSPVLSDNISSLDANSLIILSDLPIQSKFLNSMATSPSNSEIVFKFSVIDYGTLDDDATIISTMKFYNTLIDSGLDWKKHVAGAIIKRDGEVIAKTDKVDEDQITFSSLDIEITNGSQSEFELSVYFKKSLIPDHAKFQVEIRTNHDWKTSSTGSSLLNELSEGIQSPIHEIDVNADRLSFVSYPKGIDESENFMLTIAAVDEFQNIDSDKSSSISLSSKSGVLSHTGVIGNLDNGILEVSDLSFTGDQILELTASSDLQPVAKEMFVQAANVIFLDDFESNDLSLWENPDAWTTSSYSFINGGFSLKHNLTNAIGSSCITCPLNNIEVGAESIFWEFILQNSDWDPTSSNNFVFHLLMDSNDSELAEVLYSVGVNLSGSDDRLSLWKTESEDSELLLKSDFDWNEAETVAIKVEYNSRGEWKLSYNRLGNSSHWLEAGIAISEVKPYIENWYSGLEFNFETASRAGELWFDDLRIETYNTAPYLRNYEVLADSIVLNFSEDLNVLASTKLESFEFFLGEVPILIKEVKSGSSNNQLVLVFENALITGNYNLKVRFIEDLKGGISNEETIRFDFYEEVMEHDLVINEIFADESPVVGLPEYEFIEVYNTSDYPIKLEDFKLKVGNTEKISTNYEIASHEYLILCLNAASEYYKEFGNVLGLSSFPSMTNSGTKISLESSSGVLLDEVTYSSDWYGDEDKDDGGWSLERIDMTNYCSTVSNWKASKNGIGGTPGEDNSVKDVYQDTQAPELVSYNLISNQALLIEFSEMVNEDSALSLLNYTIEENAVSSIIKKSDTTYLLHFVNVFQDGVDQNIVMNKLVDECGNSKQLQVSFVWREVQEHDLVINEIFADESPVVGLPEYEFIEIYNASDYPIKLEGFKLKVGSTEKILTNYEIASHEYLILCSNTASEYYKEFGNVLGLSSFPSMTNSGTNISLESSTGILIDEITYSSDWYGDDAKKGGGWSIERIDMTNYCSTLSNWKASQNKIGGTPGMANSIKGIYQDTQAPDLVSYNLISNQALLIEFSEMVNEDSALSLLNYTIEENAVSSIIKKSDTTYLLHFVSVFQDGVDQKLFMNKLVDECGNSKQLQVSFVWREVHEYNLVINEIFADESPVVGLPEYEFVEIYNTSDYPIKLEDFKLKVGNTEKILTNYEIASHEYLILCSNAASEYYKEFGNVLGLSSFPSMINSGTNISLESSLGILIDEVTYSSDWYGDDAKKDGGWSLERIDMTNYCSTLSNWKASKNGIGGTPGMDNSIKGIYQDTQPPELVSYNLISNQALLIEFSEMVNEDSALSLLNYTIEENAISSIIKKSDKIYLLHFASIFQDGVDQKLFMNKLVDECGNSKQLQVSFVWREVHEYNLVINEIFADESPVVSLPEYEFIEVYNTSDYPIKLEDFKLKVGNTEKILTNYEIASHEYLILCSNAASEYYKEFGNVLSLSSFPSMTNSGTNISLESSLGVLLDEVTYSSDWYGDEDKDDGGWSLERIDMNNHSWQADNWRASIDAKGGTPGQANSILADNPDNTDPSLLYFEIDKPNSLRLYFSETLNSPQVYLPENYSIDNGINHPNSIQEIDNEKFALSLSFASNFESNIQYQFSLSDQLSDLEGNLFVEREFKFLLADLPKEGDLVINEVLFNPYPNGADYVELLNISDRIIDIKDLLIANRDENYQLDDVYQLSDKSRMLEANSYLLLSSDTANVKLNYSYLDESAFVLLTRMPSYNDDEGRVVILNKDNEQIDDFAYDESMHFSQLTSDEGVSLERINPNKETNSRSNWISASQTANFGTPGMQNSSYDIDEIEVNEIGFKSKIFSPDNDGVDDRLVINFNLEKSGYVANIRVYNSLGREIRRLASNMTLSTNDELFWDGLLANEERAPIGIYAFYFELFHPDGEVKTYKKTCVLGGKFK